MVPAAAEEPIRHMSSDPVADVLGTKLIGPTMEVSAEVLNTMEVRANRCLGEVAATQLLKHELTQMGHREFLLFDTI